MLRTILSYSVLVFIPAVSLAIAVVPYVWVKRKCTTPVIASRAERGVATPLDATNEIASSKTPRNDNTGAHWKHLWLAFMAGLVGNLVWWWIIVHIPSEASYHLKQSDYSGTMLSWILYGILLIVTPFIFFKLKHGKYTVRQIVYCVLLALIILSFEAAAAIIIFFIGWSRL